MHLPSFLWLWKIAAWSMGLSLAAYFALAATGLWMRVRRRKGLPLALRPWHLWLGNVLVSLTLLLLTIGVVGTLGHFGSLGHSFHLVAGVGVTGLVLLSAWSARQISPRRAWARRLHLGSNGALFLGLMVVLATGWQVVQKYLLP